MKKNKKLEPEDYQPNNLPEIEDFDSIALRVFKDSFLALIKPRPDEDQSTFSFIIEKLGALSLMLVVGLFLLLIFYALGNA